jgi:hypothetical protein
MTSQKKKEFIERQAPRNIKSIQNYVNVNLDNPIGTHGSRDEDEKPAKNEITQEDFDEDDVYIEEKA